jgi:hypothetical protein
MKLSREEKKRMKDEINLAFEAIKEIIKKPEKLESLPRQSFLTPVRVRATK